MTKYIFFFLCTLLTLSCANPCKKIECGTHGTCNEASKACDCQTGYELDASGKCDQVARDKFIGFYNVGEACVGGGYYAVEIAAHSTDIEKVILKGFSNISKSLNKLEVIAEVKGNTLHIPTQSIDFEGDTYTVNENTSTELKLNSFWFEYSMFKNGNSFRVGCNANYEK